MMNSARNETGLPNFRSIDFLKRHVRSIMSFYYPQCIDAAGGGYFQHFNADGNVSSNSQKHLVSSSRLTINFAVAAKLFDDQNLLASARHGVDFLRNGHRLAETGSYVWTLENGQASDADNHCYGLAFVLMAYARCYEAGLNQAYDHIEETFQFMERHFWREQDQLYVDVIAADLNEVSPYRGQNANMHCCEAMISAYEATTEQHYLDRAIIIAHRITVELAAQCDGKIWEHYNDHWQVDFTYNTDDRENKLRPWGYQPGHFIEWAKLLLLIDKYSPQAWLGKRAKDLFDKAMEAALDHDHGGLFYGFSPSGDICSDGKYSWVQAETIAATAMLAVQQQDRTYWNIYHQFWQYVWANMIDHEQGCWHRNLTHDNKIIPPSSVAMGKTDYHSICSCIEIINLLS